MEFTSLASSSAGCCYRLSAGGGTPPLLIDCGLRFAEIRQALEFRVTTLAGCLISHAHGDHCKAALDIMGSGVNVYASAPTFAEIGITHHRAKVLTDRVKVTVGCWDVLPFEVVHDCPGTMGFLVGSPDGSRLLYLTDSCYSPFRFDGLTHLAVECNHSLELMRENVASGRVDAHRYERTARSHMSLERLLELLAANDLSQVEAIYLLHLSSANSDEEAFMRRVQEATGRPVYVCAERSVC